MESLLTVVVPIHNMYKKLNRLNDWISTIGGSEVEVILVDDFSSEESSREIRDLVDSHSSLNIKVVSGRYKSPGKARNAGLLKATGLWVIFADSDDILHLNPILNKLANSAPKMIEVFQFRELDFNSIKILKPLSKTSSDTDLVLNLGIWRMAFPARFLVNKKFTEIRMGEDLLYFLDVFEGYPEINFNAIHSYDYLIGSGNQLTADINALHDLTRLLDALSLKIDINIHTSTLAKLMYFKNTLSVAKHLGLTKSNKFAFKSAMFFLRSAPRDKKKFIEIMMKSFKS
jgi:glycosyltransferase involved in cell wall biosynthesis